MRDRAFEGDERSIVGDETNELSILKSRLANYAFCVYL